MLNKLNVATAVLTAMRAGLNENATCSKAAEDISKLFPKFEQIAFYAPDMAALKQAYSALGCKTWVDDTVTAEGCIGHQNIREGNREINVAKLSFNYELGTELELISYPAGNNWHRVGGRIDDEGRCSAPFLSHMSYHVESIHTEQARLERAGFKLIQWVRTLSHTNSYLLEKKRKYHYAIFDTRELLGFDVKLIQRVEGN